MLRAIRPEAGDIAGKSTVTIHGKDSEVTVDISAESTAALRAAFNSYLRWLSMIERVEELADHSKRTLKRGAGSPKSHE